MSTARKSTQTPTFAIITRTQGRRPLLLKRAIESVARQSLTDYTHVIVNDGGNAALIEQIVSDCGLRAQKTVQVFHRKTASGAPDTIFNESIDRVNSTYIAMHDDDDTWHPSFLATVTEHLRAGAEGVVVRTDRVYEKLEGGSVKTTKKKHYLADMNSISLYRQCFENQLTPIAFVYSRKAYKKVGRYDDSLAVAGDWEFGIRFLQEYDVEYVDPGFALAQYHERVGEKDNSYALHSHRQHITKIANKHLREDLKNGGLGIGYIISKLRYDQDIRSAMIKKIVPNRLLKTRKRH